MISHRKKAAQIAAQIELMKVFYSSITKTTLPHCKSKSTDLAQLTNLIY